MNTAQVIWIATMITAMLGIVVACLIATVVRLERKMFGLREKREIDECKRRELKRRLEDANILCADLLARVEQAELLAKSPENALEILRDVIARFKEER